MSNPVDAEKRYFEETAHVLRRENFHVEQLPDGHLNVLMDDQSLCEVNKVGGITYRNVSTQDRIEARDKAFKIVSTTAEYMRQMESAPPLAVSNLKDRFKVLADFNRTILAAENSSRGVLFVTWNWDYDHKGVSYGHYYDTNYAAAKLDFVIRSQLIPKQSLFSDKQLIEIYRCCADTLDAGFDLTYDQEKCIRSVQEQIKYGMPDIMVRIKEQDQQYADYFPQEPTI